MESQKLKELLEMIDMQVSSPILGGMEVEYEELEAMGYVNINREAIQHVGTLTPAGLVHLEELRRHD